MGNNLPAATLSISDLIGIPFADGGRGPDSYDCFGLLEELYRRRGIFLPTEPNPLSLEQKGVAIAASIERGEWVRIKEPEPYCAVAFRMIPPYVTHIGMVLECRQKFIHTREGTNVAIERLNNIVWRHRIAGFYIHA